MRFADLTTLRVGGEIADYRRATDEREIIDIVSSCDSAKRPLVIIAGGSNLLVSDEAIDATVLHIASTGTSLSRDACSGGTITVAAGHPWDEFVASVVEFGFSGVEALSGIPGSVGATPIQNVGAYGQQVSDVIARVRTFDRAAQAVRTFAAVDCGFGYRTSIFKNEPHRWVILDVTYQLRNATLSEPIRYAELAQFLGVEVGARVPLVDAREGVLALRRGKGMVLDPNDHDTWSAGSFFLNPVLPSENDLPADVPRWPQPDGSVKVPAAWLIENAGIARGMTHGGAAISSKHTLALTNIGSATAQEILELAREVRDRVSERFGITLQPEVRMVGLEL